VNKSTQQHCYVYPKKLTPWRDSNPGLQATILSKHLLFPPPQKGRQEVRRGREGHARQDRPRNRPQEGQGWFG
jgi:hypothetical protein